MADARHTQEEKTLLSLQVPWLKLAIAVAIIRNKPHHIVAQDHAQNLCTDFMFLQNTLQLKYKQAQEMIIQLQRKVRASDSKETSDLQEIELQTPPSSATSLLAPTLSLEIQSNATDQLLSPSTRITADTCLAPFSNTNLLERQMDNQTDVSLVESAVFMQSMINLRSLATQELHSMKQDDIVESAVTHINAMKHVVLRGMATIPASSLQDGIESIMFLLEMSPWLPHQPKIMQEVCSLVEEIIKKITNKQSQDGREKQTFVNMLLVFLRGGCQCLVVSVLESLIECFESFCTALQTSQSARTPADSDLFDNSFFIIKCLELTMKQWQNVCPVGPQAIMDVQRKLKKCLWQVADYFPVVAQAVWRVTTLTEAILQT